MAALNLDARPPQPPGDEIPPSDIDVNLVTAAPHPDAQPPAAAAAQQWLGDIVEEDLVEDFSPFANFKIRLKQDQAHFHQVTVPVVIAAYSRYEDMETRSDTLQHLRNKLLYDTKANCVFEGAGSWQLVEEFFMYMDDGSPNTDETLNSSYPFQWHLLVGNYPSKNTYRDPERRGELQRARSARIAQLIRLLSQPQGLVLQDGTQIFGPFYLEYSHRGNKQQFVRIYPFASRGDAPAPDFEDWLLFCYAVRNANVHGIASQTLRNGAFNFQRRARMIKWCLGEIDYINEQLDIRGDDAIVFTELFSKLRLPEHSFGDELYRQRQFCSDILRLISFIEGQLKKVRRIPMNLVDAYVDTLSDDPPNHYRMAVFVHEEAIFRGATFANSSACDMLYAIEWHRKLMRNLVTRFADYTRFRLGADREHIPDLSAIPPFYREMGVMLRGHFDGGRIDESLVSGSDGDGEAGPAETLQPAASAAQSSWRDPTTRRPSSGSRSTRGTGVTRGAPATRHVQPTARPAQPAGGAPANMYELLPQSPDE